MLKDLQDHVQYHKRLLSQYGYDWKAGKWDTKQFPVTQTDSQMKGFKSDVNRYRKAVGEYNEYVKSLARKYKIDVEKEYCVISSDK